MIRNGHADCVLVVACDSVTEFIFSGFSSLMALDKQPARPFDRSRAGLNVGEAAAYALIMSEERAAAREPSGPRDDSRLGTERRREPHDRPVARERGTGPGHHESACRPRASLLVMWALSPRTAPGPCTTTRWRCALFAPCFKDGPRPVYSIKGGIGHTMGAAGLVEMLIAQRALREGIVPPTVNLKEV